MQWIDTHAHLSFEPIFSRLEMVLQRAADAKVTKVLVPSYDVKSWETVSSLLKHRSGTKQGTGVFGAFGLHPWKAHETLSIPRLKTHLSKEGCIAIGEIGLDFKIDNADAARQRAVLRAQLDLAVELNLPVMFHCRGAFSELIEILKEYSGKVRGVVHAFSRGPELADAFLKLGLYIAFGGAITRTNAGQARKSAAHVPLERLVLETDCPSIGLDGVASRDTEPMHVAQIGVALAALRNIPPEMIASATTENAARLFFHNIF